MKIKEIIDILLHKTSAFSPKSPNYGNFKDMSIVYSASDVEEFFSLVHEYNQLDNHYKYKFYRVYVNLRESSFLDDYLCLSYRKCATIQEMMDSFDGSFNGHEIYMKSDDKTERLSLIKGFEHRINNVHRCFHLFSNEQFSIDDGFEDDERKRYIDTSALHVHMMDFIQLISFYIENDAEYGKDVFFYKEKKGGGYEILKREYETWTDEDEELAAKVSREHAEK